MMMGTEIGVTVHKLRGVGDGQEPAEAGRGGFHPQSLQRACEADRPACWDSKYLLFESSPGHPTEGWTEAQGEGRFPSQPGTPVSTGGQVSPGPVVREHAGRRGGGGPSRCQQRHC